MAVLRVFGWSTSDTDLVQGLPAQAVNPPTTEQRGGIRKMAIADERLVLCGELPRWIRAPKGSPPLRSGDLAFIVRFCVLTAALGTFVHPEGDQTFTTPNRCQDDLHHLRGRTLDFGDDRLGIVLR